MKSTYLIVLVCLWSFSIGALTAWTGMSDVEQSAQYEKIQYVSSEDGGLK